MRLRKDGLFAVSLGALLLVALNHHSSAQAVDGFPAGFDAVQAAPASHHVIFENSLVRVLQVTLPPPGSAEPMHFHRWPSLFLGFDTGGKTAHIRYHTPDGKVRDVPSETEPTHPGVWSASWMKPEPMHSIEVVSAEAPGPGSFPGWLRVEIKVPPTP
ncbi:MAG TPA: hypothetical protein VGF88_05810 [Acidobacteriaceae bacterium]|jgi:hypothetical protein